MDIFLWPSVSFFHLPLSERQLDIDWNAVSKLCKPKSINQPSLKLPHMLWFFIRTTHYVVVSHINCRVFLCSNNRTDQYVSLLCLKCCGPSLNLLGWGSSNEKMQHMLLVEKLEKPLRILLESLTLLAPVTKIGEFYKQLRSWWSSSLWAASTRSTLFFHEVIEFPI